MIAGCGVCILRYFAVNHIPDLYQYDTKVGQVEGLVVIFFVAEEVGLRSADKRDKFLPQNIRIIVIPQHSMLYNLSTFFHLGYGLLTVLSVRLPPCFFGR